MFGLWKKFIFYLFGLGKKQPRLTEEEFEMLVSDVGKEGVLNETEQELIHRTLRYDELAVSDCMIPLDRVYTNCSVRPIFRGFPSIRG